MNVKKKIRLLIVVTITICLILIALIIGLNVKNTSNINEYKYYSSVKEVGSLEQLINLFYGKLIKVVDSSEEKFYKDIYVNLKYGLYEGEVSKKDFYNQMVKNVAEMMNYENYRIIDEGKNIEIKAISSNGELLGSIVNGDTDYYGHYESQKNLASYEEIELTELTINSKEVNTLIENDWYETSLQFSKADSVFEKYEEYAKLGVNIYEIQKKVFNIVFDLRYSEDVVSSIRVGETFENIINILGKPTFGRLNSEYIGYKGKDIYVFFSANEISVYRNDTIEKDEEFIKLLEKYAENNSVKELITNLTDVWSDYENYDYNEESVDLLYAQKGIRIQLGTGEPQGVIVYNNYTGKIVKEYTQAELKEKEIEIPRFIFFTNADAIDEYEKQRVYSTIVSDDIPESEIELE